MRDVIERHAWALTDEELRVLAEREISIKQAQGLFMEAFQCSRATFYNQYREYLRVYSRDGIRSAFCLEHEVIRTIARLKRAQRELLLSRGI